MTTKQVRYSLNKLKWGFAMIVANDDRIDQDDQIENISSATGQANALARKFYRQNTSTAIGLGLAGEVEEWLEY